MCILMPSKEKLLAVALSTAVLTGCWAQQHSNKAFDISSVKQTRPGNNRGGIRRLDVGIVAISSMTVKDMILTFYYLKPFQLINLPDWADRDRFDVTAKDSTVSASQGTITAEMRSKALDADAIAMQEILQDRFKLRFHHETKTLPTLLLTLDSKKPLMETPCSERYALQHGVVKGAIHVTSLSALLQTELGLPVKDATGLKGCYFMDEHWSQEADDEVSPAVATSLHHLGFKLEKSKGDVDVVVIDQVEHPQPD